ncbi:MAG: isopenicillin N synthase-like dioxygenase, partial [Gammaproteobacteria bacterium]
MSDAIAKDHIPVIELGPSFFNDSGHDAVADQIAHACETLGFLIVTGHSVAKATIDNMIDSSVAFFTQAIEARVRAMPPSPYVFRGYFPSEASALAASLDIETPGDLCEVYCINRFDDPEDAARAGMNKDREMFFAPNIWPEDVADFKRAWITYYSAMESLTNHLLTLMAKALNLPNDWFDPFCDQHTT